jgi:multimeric flavodoxin WrbA
MKALILNGGGPAKPYGDIAARAESWLAGRGIPAASFDLTAMDIRPCRGCFACWTKTPGRCFQNDAMAGVLPHLAHADIVVWITPIAYGGYGFHLKKALDRSIPVLLPFFVKLGAEVHHPMRYGTEARLAAIGVLPAPDAESERIFGGLVGRNAINMHARAFPLVLHEGREAGPWEKLLEPLLAGKEN